MSQTVIDQLGQVVVVPDSPRRIVSLVPSQTELLFDLGLDAEIAGVTRFCIHPADKVSAKVRVGGTKNLDIDLIKSLSPDLIIGNKEENYKDGIDELKRHFPVWMSDICTLQDAYSMMAAIGQITGRQREAAAIISEIGSGLAKLSTHSLCAPARSCAYFVWRKPYMVAASGTFIDHMLGVLGLRNSFSSLSRYPSLTHEQISDASPDIILLSSEPYTFTDRHIDEFKELCPMAQIRVVDGELFSWYGSRLRYSAAYFGKLRQQLLISA